MQLQKIQGRRLRPTTMGGGTAAILIAIAIAFLGVSTLPPDVDSVRWAKVGLIAAFLLAMGRHARRSLTRRSQFLLLLPIVFVVIAVATAGVAAWVAKASALTAFIATLVAVVMLAGGRGRGTPGFGWAASLARSATRAEHAAEPVELAADEGGLRIGTADSADSQTYCAFEDLAPIAVTAEVGKVKATLVDFTGDELMKLELTDSESIYQLEALVHLQRTRRKAFQQLDIDDSLVRQESFADFLRRVRRLAHGDAYRGAISDEKLRRAFKDVAAPRESRAAAGYLLARRDPAWLRSHLSPATPPLVAGFIAATTEGSQLLRQTGATAALAWLDEETQREIQHVLGPKLRVETGGGPPRTHVELEEPVEAVDPVTPKRRKAQIPK